MNVALVMVTDGRWDCLARTLAAVDTYLDYPFVVSRIVDDSGDPTVLGGHHPPDGFEVVHHPQRRGLAAAVRSAWTALPASVDYIFHLEDDFLLIDPVDIDAMAATLEQYDQLAQLVLKRQPWSPIERAAGGIIETAPGEYRQHDGFVEHTRIFSLNPCLIPRRIVDRGWPDGNEAEFTAKLVADGYSFGFWGGRADPPRCIHIGVHRAVGWKL